LAAKHFVGIVPINDQAKSGVLMKKVLLCIVLVLTLISFSSLGQDEIDCSADAIQADVDRLYEDYAASRGEDALAELSALNAAIEELISSCTRDVAVESTEAAPGETLTAAQLIEGKWAVQWSSTGQTNCPGQSRGTRSENRNFILTVDSESDSFVADDILVWPPLVFTASIEGGYQFLRNIARTDGTVVSFDYQATLVSESRIEGVNTFFDPTVGCALEDNFVMTLVDETIICMVASDSGANLRSGAGTDFQRNGALPAGERTDVIGQANGSDGFTWWQLDSEAWVRSDLVEEAGHCEEVPVIAS
jgi:hypothetical protein